MTAARNLDGRLELFARGTDNALIHSRQAAAGSCFGAGWESLGGDFANRASALLNRLEVLPAADGRLEVFVVGNDGALMHIFQTAPNNGWSKWESLGGVLASAP